MFQENQMDINRDVTVYQPIKRKRGRPRTDINSERVQQALDAYSSGMPRYIAAFEFGLSEPTLRRLITEYENVNGKLRLQKVLREK